jgi:hypothetical protein
MARVMPVASPAGHLSGRGGVPSNGRSLEPSGVGEHAGVIASAGHPGAEGHDCERGEPSRCKRGKRKRPAA